MPATDKDPELAALEAVHNALKPLGPDARRKVLDSVQVLLGITSADTTLQQAPKVPGPSTSKMEGSRPLSLIELMQEKKPGTIIQKIALFAYYRERYKGLARFARNDLLPYFGEAHEPPPGNFDRDFVEAVKRGWIHEDGAESYITSKGIEAVEAGFPGGRTYERSAKPGTRQARAKAKTANRKKKPR